MSLRLKALFGPDRERYEGVYRLNIYLLRILFGLMVLFLGIDSWTYILAHRGTWDPVEAAAWCIWASYSALAVVGLIHPLKMLPLVLLEITYKVLWLILVAYPLWSTDQLAGSPAENMTYAFMWVILAIVAVPWKYAVETYIWKAKAVA